MNNTGIEIRLREALKGIPIRDYSFENLVAACVKLLVQSYVLMGYQHCNDRDMSILASKMASDLLETYPYMSMEEVSICFEVGIKGLWGDFTGINIRTISKWMKGFSHSDMRYKAVLERDREKNMKSLPAISEEYKKEHELIFLRNVYRQYKAGYPLERLYPVKVYNSLRQLGFIKNTKEEMTHAMELFQNWQPTRKSPGNLKIPEDYRQELIKHKAMTYLLKEYFDSLIAKAS